MYIHSIVMSTHLAADPKFCFLDHQHEPYSKMHGESPRTNASTRCQSNSSPATQTRTPGWGRILHSLGCERRTGGLIFLTLRCRCCSSSPSGGDLRLDRQSIQDLGKQKSKAT
ncbi:hypothetical protein HZ326_10752 [Fusarium oxysporum f. sp. albedinis]|nr:hypothetical protein HZ326_10752 [Fusarium oxysporum f. sp. albedinis]